MRAWKFEEFGNIEDLRLTECPTPEPGEGEALVRVERAALNPADRYLVEGLYPGCGPLPQSVGRDGSGVIEKSAGKFQVGDRVNLLRGGVGVRRDGTLAEYVTVPEESLTLTPEGWNVDEAAAGPLVLLTAWRALVHEGELQAGQTVLITGASGGVGTASVMLAKALGAKVVALSRSEEKRATLEKMGADITVDSSDPKWSKAAKQKLEGGRVNVVVENLGGSYLQGCLQLLDKDGRIGVVGLLSGLFSEIQVALIIHKRARIQGVHCDSYTPALAQTTWAEIVEVLAKADVRPPVDRVFGFGEVQEAFAHLKSGPMGKVVIDVTK